MKTIIILIVIAALICIAAGCGNGNKASKATYQQITQAEAQRIMDEEEGFVIVDVRRQDEYDSGHIPGAILIPNESIDKTPPEELPDFDQTILVYCRSGNRSKQAAQKLADMGYTDIREFGGINTWPGETTTE
ncbi:MAG: rhodanese-like domain-containing protein [Firmicutes bacterium]|nr:rhodanese-like domain-containing protein [Bacillota bacterium]MBR6025189.1 rhodanese-like domain-containing protein [Bacillota bacterium]